MFKFRLHYTGSQWYATWGTQWQTAKYDNVPAVLSMVRAYQDLGCID
jgi:hypothetical protein